MRGPRQYGFRREGENLAVDPTEASVRREMVELFLKHQRLKTVARLLNETGHRTRRGSRFSDTSVLRLLRDPSAVQGIIDKETWERCQVLLKDRAESGNPLPRRHAHYLGGVAECACGGPLRVRGDGPGARFICRSCRSRVQVITLDRLIRESFRKGTWRDTGTAEGAPPETQGSQGHLFQRLHSVWPSLNAEWKREFVALLVARVIVGTDEIRVGFRVSPAFPRGKEAQEANLLPSCVDLPPRAEGATERGNESSEGAPLLSVEDAARLLRTTPRAVYVMAGRGILPGVTRIGRRLLVRREDLVRWLDESRAPSPVEDRR